MSKQTQIAVNQLDDAQYLEAIAQISQIISSAKDTKTLNKQLSDTIRKLFGFYQVLVQPS